MPDVDHAAGQIIGFNGTPDDIIHATAVVAEIVRRLNHSTLTETLTPPELDRTVSALQTAVQRLPQLITQIAANVGHWVGGPHLTSDDGQDPGRVAFQAQRELTAAVDGLVRAETHLNRARQHTARLYLTEEPC